MPTLHWWTGASSMSPYVMTVTWRTVSGIILHHRSIAYELSIYCSSLIYFFVAIVIITTKYQKYYFLLSLLLLPLQPLSYYFATKHFAADTKFPGVVELTTQLLILENILWLPFFESINLGWILYPRKLLQSPILVGYHLPWVTPWNKATPVPKPPTPWVAVSDAATMHFLESALYGRT